MKTCKRCAIAKPPSDFSKDSYNPDGLRRDCKACAGLAKRAYRAKVRAKAAPEFEITVEEPPPLPPLENAYVEAQKSKDKRDLKREHSALIDENTKLKETISQLVTMQKPADVLIYKKPAWERSDAIACAVASDWHVEEPVAKDAVHGLNEYNLDVAKYRSELFFKNLLRLTDMMARDSKITTINLDFLGDFFSGYIHDELIAGNLLAPGSAAHFCQGLMISGIEFLLRESSYIITGDMIPGNHGRMTKHIWFGDPTGTSLETFMYHAIAGRFTGNPRVQLKVSEHAMVYRKYFEKFVVRKIHGYEVKFGGGVGGLTIPLNKALAQWDIAVRSDLTLLGHFHQLFDGGNFIANGSLIGYNTFAQAIKAKFEEPKQAFYLVHARKGGQKSITAPIWLDTTKAVAS